MNEQTKHDRIFLSMTQGKSSWIVLNDHRTSEDDVEYIRADIVAEQLAAKDALLSKVRDAFLQFTSRKSMDDLESFGYSADAVIEAIDRELK